jgi:hypothetical protein
MATTCGNNVIINNYEDDVEGYPKRKTSVENPRKRWLDDVKNNLKEVDGRG